jgi:uncharacterized repeat protein (TIGR03803 family)
MKTLRIPLVIILLAVAGRTFHATAQTLTTLYSFTGDPDGGQPNAGLVQDSDGNFYGTTTGIGSSGNGTVFKISPTATLTTLYAFTGGADGGAPYASLTQSGDGNFYGTTSGNETGGNGTVFKISPAGTLTTLYTFTGGADGSYPQGGLAQGSDVDFYGTTSDFMATGNGTVFKISPAGTLTTLYTFTGGADGAEPLATLVQGSDGNFYGTTSVGGTNGAGTVFKISPAGRLTTLHTFAGSSDGEYPVAELTQGSDGDFYGTTFRGGVSGWGTVFKISPAGMLTTLHTFTGNSDGELPAAALVVGSDGNFYSTTAGVGTSGSLGHRVQDQPGRHPDHAVHLYRRC